MIEITLDNARMDNASKEKKQHQQRLPHTPILPRRQWRRNLLYLILVPVFMRNHCGSGRFCLIFFANFIFSVKVFTEPMATYSVLQGNATNLDCAESAQRVAL